MRPLVLEEDLTFWFETHRVLGHVAYGGADIGETLTTALRITPGDYDSWLTEWAATATRVEEEARAQLAAGHRISARDGLLRSATYLRSAEFFTRDREPDPRGRSLYDRSVRCFQDAAALMDASVHPVEIPFEGSTLNGYLYGSPARDRGGPAIVMHNGFDGSVEEMHHAGAAAAQERGYVVLTFDGPGQPGPRYRDGLVFRPDWETVVSAVVDWLLDRSEVDPSRIALMGNSMGGELAPRAAAFDERIRALICIDGVYDVGAVYAGALGAGHGHDIERRLAADVDDDLDSRLEALARENTQVRWAMRQGMWSFGADTPRAFLAKSLDYHLRDGIAERVRCPTFVGRAEADEFFGGQPEQLAEHLGGPVTLVDFRDDEGAGAHCQVGAQRLLCGRMYDWLDEVFA